MSSPFAPRSLLGEIHLLGSILSFRVSLNTSIIRTDHQSPTPTAWFSKYSMNLMTSKINIPALVGQLKALNSADFKDDAERKSLYEAARAATFTSETSEDSIHRIANAVKYSHHPNRLSTHSLILILQNSRSKPPSLRLPKTSGCLGS